MMHLHTTIFYYSIFGVKKYEFGVLYQNYIGTYYNIWIYSIIFLLFYTKQMYSKMYQFIEFISGT